MHTDPPRTQDSQPRPRIWATRSPEGTIQLGKTLGHALQGGLVVTLDGILGSGKTHLVKGIAQGNGLDQLAGVTSPTFTLVHEYPGRLRLFHIDAYRLRSPDEAVALGMDEMIAPDSAVVIEWASRITPVLPDHRLGIRVDVTGGESRQFTVEATGPIATAFLDELALSRR